MHSYHKSSVYSASLTTLILLILLFNISWWRGEEAKELKDEEVTNESDLIDGWTSLVVSNERSNSTAWQGKLLDFAVSGFQKCGTTTMLRSLSNHSQIYMGVEDGEEPHEIRLRKEGAYKRLKEDYGFIEHWGSTTSDGKPIYQGIKSPNLLLQPSSMKRIARRFSKIDFIVNVRHPVLFFESLYNYKHRPDVFKSKRPDALTLIGKCQYFHCGVKKHCETVPGHVCTESAKFHYGLSALMITPMNTKEELDLVDHHDWTRFPDFEGRIFLSEIGQMADNNTTRQSMYKNGIEEYIGLEKDTFHFLPRNTTTTRDHFLDICEDRYEPLREVLLKIGTKASKWILDYMLESPRVVVANREHFVVLIKKWQQDPCEDKRGSRRRHASI